MRKKLIAIFAGLISSLILPFLVSSASAEEVRSMKLWAREQAAGPAPHTAALIIAQTLNELGLDITVNAVPWPQMADQVWYKRLDEDTWDLTMWQMVSRPERSDPDEFTYNLFHYISKIKKNVEVIRNDKIDGKTVLRKKYDKIVISPGPGNPNQAGNCLEIVKEVHKKVPILGVCLGHQIIGQVFGGKIINAKNLMHGKTSKIKHNKKGLFKNIHNNFEATRYHSLVVDRKKFPKKLLITAETKNKTIMGLMHKEYDIHGFQFHPESISTKVGMKLIKNFIID